MEIDASACAGTSDYIRYLEHVEVILSLSFTRRGDLAIYVTSPSGTRSTLLAKRRLDYSSKGFKNWSFMSTHTWQENPRGRWTLEIQNVGKFRFQNAVVSCSRHQRSRIFLWPNSTTNFKWRHTFSFFALLHRYFDLSGFCTINNKCVYLSASWNAVSRYHEAYKKFISYQLFTPLCSLVGRALHRNPHQFLTDD